jgi:hypothetical protein
MNLHGWCLRCHKVKRVRVTMPRAGVPVGICMDCEKR